MARRKIDAAEKEKALAACAESLKATGKLEFEKNAKAAGVTEATLRAWWGKAHGPVRKKKDGAAKAKVGAKRRGRPAGKGKRLGGVEKSIGRIETELKQIRALFADYRQSIIRKLSEDA